MIAAQNIFGSESNDFYQDLDYQVNTENTKYSLNEWSTGGEDDSNTTTFNLPKFDLDGGDGIGEEEQFEIGQEVTFEHGNLFEDLWSNQLETESVIEVTVEDLPDSLEATQNYDENSLYQGESIGANDEKTDLRVMEPEFEDEEVKEEIKVFRNSGIIMKNLDTINNAYFEGSPNYVVVEVPQSKKNKKSQKEEKKSQKKERSRKDMIRMEKQNRETDLVGVIELDLNKAIEACEDTPTMAEKVDDIYSQTMKPPLKLRGEEPKIRLINMFKHGGLPNKMIKQGLKEFTTGKYLYLESSEREKLLKFYHGTQRCFLKEEKYNIACFRFLENSKYERKVLIGIFRDKYSNMDLDFNIKRTPENEEKLQQKISKMNFEDLKLLNKAENQNIVLPKISSKAAKKVDKKKNFMSGVTTARLSPRISRKNSINKSLNIEVK